MQINWSHCVSGLPLRAGSRTTVQLSKPFFIKSRNRFNYVAFRMQVLKRLNDGNTQPLCGYVPDYELDCGFNHSQSLDHHSPWVISVIRGKANLSNTEPHRLFDIVLSASQIRPFLILRRANAA